MRDTGARSRLSSGRSSDWDPRQRGTAYDELGPRAVNRALLERQRLLRRPATILPRQTLRTIGFRSLPPIDPGGGKPRAVVRLVLIILLMGLAFSNDLRRIFRG